VVSLAHLWRASHRAEAVSGSRRPPRAGASLDDLFGIARWIAPGFEVVQSHMPGWKFTAAQTVGDRPARSDAGRPKVRIADLASRADELDRMLAGARSTEAGTDAPVEEGTGTNVLDSPLRALMHFSSNCDPALRHGWSRPATS